VNKVEISYGFLAITHIGEPAECDDPLCSRFISPGEVVYIDTQEGAKLYCKFCGPCERYHRKKDQEREDRARGTS
jgi:hypothetical protein